MKNLAWIAAVLLLLVLFPGLVQAVIAVVAAAAVWLSTQPVLVAFGLGLLAWPHLHRAAKHATPAGH